MAHTDVVFPDEEELPLKEEGDRIFCPGIGDDTACLVCLLLGAKYLAGAIREGRLEEVYPSDRPGLLFVCNSGEEGLGNLKASGTYARIMPVGSQLFVPLTASWIRS